MTQKLREIAEIQIGYQVRGQKRNVANGPYRLIQMRDVDDDAYLNAEGLASLDVDSPERYRVESGDILFQARGGRHLAFVLDSVPRDTLASNHFYIVRVHADVHADTILPAYLAWWVNQPPAQAQFVARAHRTTMTLVPREAFESLEVEIPPLAIQRKIVELNELVRRDHELTTRLHEKRDALVGALCLRAAGGNSTGREDEGETPHA